jgi:hypothetical protein
MKRKRQRTVSIIAVTVIVAMAIVSVLWQSYQQNAHIRLDFNKFFTALAQRDIGLIRKTYGVMLLNTQYEDQLAKYHLLGWKITGITGQPFPMDLPEIAAGGQEACNTVSAELYYEVPNKLDVPKGKYSQITHPQYGHCLVVPVKLDFTYRGKFVKQLAIPQPTFSSDRNWVVPFKHFEEEFFN